MGKFVVHVYTFSFSHASCCWNVARKLRRGVQVICRSRLWRSERLYGCLAEPNWTVLRLTFQRFAFLSCVSYRPRKMFKRVITGAPGSVYFISLERTIVTFNLEARLYSFVRAHLDVQEWAHALTCAHWHLGHLRVTITRLALVLL